VDTLVHGVIGAALCSRTGLPGGRRGPVDERGRRRFTDWTLWMAFFFGIFPDIASLGIHFSLDWIAGNGIRWHGIPDFIFVLYNITHSLAGIAVCVALLVWWKPAWRLPVLAWPLHVLMDAPTHGDGRFMTPLFWPFTDWGVAGWNWWQYKGIFYGTWIVAGLLWLTVVILRLSGRTGRNRRNRA
jgi:hypothetical protein